VDDELELELEHDENDERTRDDDALEDGLHHSLVTARRMRPHTRDERALSRSHHSPCVH
tara:strand:- start:39 stop:215 length:177 start_codon:yes stop_codon:yes gene_type:complete